LIKLDELETWLSTGQVAQILGRSRPNVLELASRRRIRSVRTAAGWLYDPASVHEFAAELEDLRRFDAAIVAVESGEDEVIPFEQAVEEIREGRVPTSKGR
jgi:excisionase family DNA binding protein